MALPTRCYWRLTIGAIAVWAIGFGFPHPTQAGTIETTASQSVTEPVTPGPAAVDLVNLKVQSGGTGQAVELANTHSKSWLDWSGAIATDNATPVSQTTLAPASPYAPIPAQAGAAFTSGPGVGYESSFIGMDGFIPLLQTPGKNLTYVQGRLLLSTSGGNPGGNILVGYRQFNPGTNAVWGGYLGYDVRDSGRATFGQIGAGVEGIWPDVELRLNGYLPVGSNRETVERQTVASSTSTSISDVITGSQFQGNSLALNIARTTTLATTTLNRRLDEVALGGFDLEGGLKLAQWQPDGDLRSYLGIYYYAGSGVAGFVGVRGRLVARVNQYASVGVSIQGDPEFGTTGAVTVALSFPGVNRQKTAPPNSNWARMGESASRANTVAITERSQTTVARTTTTTTATVTEPARNPVTGQPWVFQHVVLGTAGGNGTFESPFGSINPAIAAAPSNGNGIVYVQAGTNPGIPAFTIKDNVQVLSTGPIQPLATVQLGTINLPLSGAGTLPTVTGSVTMGNNTVLSGFAVTPPAGATPIIATGVQNVTIRDNWAQASGNNTAGIRLQDVTGTATVTNNRIATTGNTTIAPLGAQGILVQSSGTTLANLIVTNNQISTIGSNAYGILLRPLSGAAIANVTLAGNTISTTGNIASGIFIFPNNAALSNLVISGNTVSTTGANAQGIVVAPDATSRIANVTVSGNTSTALASNSIFINPINAGSIGSVVINNNQIPQSGFDNIRINNQGGQPLCVTLTGNLTQNPGTSFNFNFLSGGVPFRVINLPNLSANNNGGTFRYDGAVAPGVNFQNVTVCP